MASELEKWKQLYGRWDDLNQAARKARGEARIALMTAAQGKGSGPTSEQLAHCDQLELVADKLRLEMDVQIFALIG
jgi:hypothetical protein